MTSEFCRRSVRAVRLGVKFSSAAALRTRADFSSDTRWPFTTRLTVAGDTPASAATS
jgi:hypothetical protein